MRGAIAQKRDGEHLSAAQWSAIVSGHQEGSVDDAQLAALLMAVVLRGMDLAEIAALTRAMLDSGEKLEAPLPNCVDKHSSGGVADSASLIVVPLAAACGIPVAKLSGRALGHTGGTLDKLEAIPGVTTALSPERFAAQVRDIGCAIAAQSDRLVPADKRIYALRDRTSTVSSLGLVASSIVSKKIAGGAQAIVFDVKVGGGAFFTKLEEASELAETLVGLTASFGRRAHALVTDMNEPLGPAIGTGLEIIEARDFLRGLRRDDRRLRSLCEALATAMLRAGGVAEDPAPLIERALIGGTAYEKFQQMLNAQGAHRGALEKLAPHAERTEIGAARAGHVRAIDTTALGIAARALVERRWRVRGNRRRAPYRRPRRRRADPLRPSTAIRPLRRASQLLLRIGDVAPPPRQLVYFETSSDRSTLAIK